MALHRKIFFLFDLVFYKTGAQEDVFNFLDHLRVTTGIGSGVSVFKIQAVGMFTHHILNAALFPWPIWLFPGATMDQVVGNGLTLRELEQIEELAQHSGTSEAKTVLRLSAALREALQAKENACAVAAEFKKQADARSRRTLRH